MVPRDQLKGEQKSQSGSAFKEEEMSILSRRGLAETSRHDTSIGRSLVLPGSRVEGTNVQYIEG